MGVLFLVAFWLWSLPLQSSRLPYGEHDAAYIFSYGDHMTYIDKSFDLVGDIPPSIVYWYAGYNNVLGPWGIQYPPPYNMGYAFTQIVGGERIVPPYIFVIITCLLGIFSMYFLMRKIFGFLPAVITSTALLFSIREIMSYLWGQRHIVFAFAFVPITIYALYKYLSSYYKKEEKISYLYIFIFLFLATYLIHFQATIFLILFAFIFVLLLALKHKRFPVKKSNLKHYLILISVFLLVSAPFYQVYFFSTEVISGGEAGDLGSLFLWLKKTPNNFFMNPIFSSHADNYMGYWTLALLFLGIFALLYRRKEEDLVLISGLITLYIIFHLPILGLISSDSYRIARYLMMETYFFYAIMSIGLIALPSFFTIPKRTKKILQYVLTILFIILLISTQGKQAYGALNNAYPPILRITPAQLKLTQWIQENTPEQAIFNLMGTLTYPKKGFIQILSRRSMIRTGNNPNQRDRITRLDKFEDLVGRVNYIIFDYSDLVLIGDGAGIQRLLKIDEDISKNASVIYAQDNIRVYKHD